MGKGYFGSCLHMWEEGSIYCTLNVSRDMVTKCPQNRQSPQKGTSVRDMGLKTPKCIIMNGALKYNPRFRSLSLCPGSWKSFWCFWRHWSLTVCLYGVWMYVFSWSPTVHVCGLQRKVSKNCILFAHGTFMKYAYFGLSIYCFPRNPNQSGKWDTKYSSLNKTEQLVVSCAK